MDDILEQAREYRQTVATRAAAHDESAEYHRHVGQVLGLAATILSAVAGSAVVVVVTKQLGLDGNGRLSLPTSALGWVGYALFVLLLVAAPVLTGMQTFLNEPEQAAKHGTSRAGYDRIQQRLDVFLLKYAKTDPAQRGDALAELERISRAIEQVAANSISLTKSAYKAAYAAADDLRERRARVAASVPSALAGAVDR